MILGFSLCIVFSQCLNRKTQTATASPPKDLSFVTHKEAVDTLRADTNAIYKPLIYKKLSSRTAFEVLQKVDLSESIKSDFPENGFFGEDRYRIEFMITEVTKDPTYMNIYRIKGKNRHKKTITAFSGSFSILDIVEITDNNLDTATVNSMDIDHIYAASGKFMLDEDPTMTKTSGTFSGTTKMEFYTRKTQVPDLWYYSEGLPSQGSGIRYDGTWTMYSKPEVVKPVIWASDLFRFADDILKDFSIGERSVEINEKYRHLGWDDFWDGQEWWADSPGKKKEL